MGTPVEGCLRWIADSLSRLRGLVLNGVCLMPTERLSMRRIRDVLRLKFEAGLSDRTLAAAVGISKAAVAAYVYCARAAGLSWPLPAEHPPCRHPTWHAA